MPDALPAEPPAARPGADPLEVGPTVDGNDADVEPLTEPREGVPDVTDTPQAFADVVDRFAAGHGPVAVDAERASGYRYGQRTYLVQIRRAGAGTALVDPVALPDLRALSRALAGTTWVLHAASQDLPGLAEQGMVPDAVFDTELAARLLGMERVGLAAVVRELLGLGLAKEHSAVDWSTRPLPAAWLRYAALDVEVLLELHEALVLRLEAAGKARWAEEEFEAVRTAPPPAPRPEPWRRISGLHSLRDPRRLAVARELWILRDAEGRRRDLSPGRVLPDVAIVAAASAMPTSTEELLRLRPFQGKATRRRAELWFSAVQRGRAVRDDELPSLRGPRSDGPPPPRAWADRDPAAAARLAAARAAVVELSERWTVPVENVLQPDLLRRVCWTPPVPTDEEALRAALTAGGARDWQVDLVAPALAAALVTVQ